MTDESPTALPPESAVPPSSPELPDVPDAPDLAPDPAPETPAPAPAGRSKRGLALGIAAALVAVAAGSGIGYAVLQHDSDSKDAAAKPASTPWVAPTPSATKAFGAKSGGSHFGSLGQLLLPMPTGYHPGPDMDAYGNDTVLDAHRAQNLFKGDLSWMSKTDRKKVDAAIDKLLIEGEGIRTYTSSDGDLMVQMELVQMKNQDAAHYEPKFFGAFTKAMGVFRNGPKVKGHSQAVCVLPPADPGDKLDSMTCEATEGDLMVRMVASGTRPLEKSAAVALLSKQLDRIQDPGKAV
ncbi:hypothetical protein GA0115240_142513 [Streptomyces sp. DvalAA-14]|uniref:hypothetical protein n=1 Tax=unclassified Streptomyces TaxID=2593676 RepID=UPI00081B85A9|nr:MULTISPECIES: hypothetical protein [unclassified Streptomyces]MYS22612.1 hypothetical protein [Streptomyces sp. SID4948]SCE19246.1 hypothetical protein GA0115240_142513 [Streptomyces sp. DvalAA-14]